ncbi:MAG: DUF4372 domain-containing protein [Paraprevotella sp.]|nr:DUF4372 domain-containing protein [Paraprevotella sp.]
MLVLIFGQLSNREGLRDFIVSLSPFKSAFHHLGFGKSVTRSNLSKANEIREFRIFKDFADKMVTIAQQKREGVKDFFISNKVMPLIPPPYLSACLYFGGQNFIMAKVE